MPLRKQSKVAHSSDIDGSRDNAVGSGDGKAGTSTSTVRKHHNIESRSIVDQFFCTFGDGYNEHPREYVSKHGGDLVRKEVP
jgi:hypothetical protein